MKLVVLFLKGLELILHFKSNFALSLALFNKLFYTLKLHGENLQKVVFGKHIFDYIELAHFVCQADQAEVHQNR